MRAALLGATDISRTIHVLVVSVGCKTLSLVTRHSAGGLDDTAAADECVLASAARLLLLWSLTAAEAIQALAAAVSLDVYDKNKAKEFELKQVRFMVVGCKPTPGW